MEGEGSTATMRDESYDFSAPRFFDFIKGESEEDVRKAELWFDTALAYAPSPFIPRIKAARSFKGESLCNFNEATDQMQKDLEASNPKDSDSPVEMKPESNPANDEKSPCEGKTEIHQNPAHVVSHDKNSNEVIREAEYPQVNRRPSAERTSSKVEGASNSGQEKKTAFCVLEGTEACTPKPATSQKADKVTVSKKHQTAKKIASMFRNPSALKPKTESQSTKAKSKPASVRRETYVKTIAGSTHLAQENQAVKRQKLEGGRSREILNLNPQPSLPHKSKLGLASLTQSLTTAKTRTAERKMYVREPAAPFVSMAEMMKKFNSSTRDLSLPHINNSVSQDAAASVIQTKPKLTLTRPKEPEFETAHRVRSVKIKSTAELEEEMMAKIPKFKARSVNKKIFEAPTLPAIPRSTPQAPVFKEFHLQTLARANQNAEISSIASTEVSRHHPWIPHLTEPRTPVLQTSLRTRPPKVKTSVELEQEELEKAPKFKARPLNKKIFESKGGLGIFVNTKKSVTKPQEFHFATDQRIPPPASVADLFDKLSLSSEPCHLIPNNTVPNPFHLHTEERGAVKQQKFVTEVMQKQWAETAARIPKANPYPYTTDYPVIPPKPQPKPFTRSEPFQLESLVRHEEERLREEAQRRRKEREEAEMRLFKAHPILKEDPIPVPEKARIPLTDVQGFNLHVEHRAVERAKFDQELKVKEMMYKRYREESEAARVMEGEKALKQLRRALVPQARPVPNFDNPFCPQKSNKGSTKAKSPNLRIIIKRKDMRNTMSAFAVASSAAAHNMR